jgi:hypothetical protein
LQGSLLLQSLHIDDLLFRASFGASNDKIHTKLP